jgi:oxalate---CoA ligase
MQICSNQLRPGTAKAGTVGIPAPGTVIVTEDDGSALPAGQLGEIRIGGPTVVAGYLNAPEITRACFINGWFKSGDIGSFDQDGFLTLHGRKDDLINRGGEKISPLEIDEALLRHPAVFEAAAFSVPHPRLGQDVAAAVVLRPGATASPIELRRYLQDQFAAFKVPGQIIVRNELPKGRTGKILRRQLAAAPEEKVGEDRAETETAAASPPDEWPWEENGAVSTWGNQLIEIWERVLKVSPVSIDDDFSEKGGDSLLAMEMLCEVERITGRKMPTSILFEARTVRQLAQTLFEQQLQPKPVIELNSHGTQPPIMFFHGDHYGGLYSTKLANFLGEDQPLQVIAPHDLGQDPLLLPVEKIASEQLELVLRAQPKGPYRLYGYCFGGLVAFEVARLLIAAGEKVEMVGMIDSPTISARRYVQLMLSAIRAARPIAGSAAIDRAATLVWHRLSKLDRPRQFSVAQRLASMTNPLRAGSAANDGQTARRPRMPTVAESRLALLFKLQIDDRPASVEALSLYSPKPLSVPVIFYAAEYSAEPWRRISPDIVSIRLSGNHRDAVRDPANLATIADDLKARLRARG